MLQQTRVDTVIAYYDRFLRRFPSVGSLARADHNEVLKHWEGLGYYKRALHLHRGARQVVEQGGAVPTNTASLRGVPGIGAYTAAAIASIAFGQRAAAVDGNVARILARLFGVRDNVLSPTGKRRLQNLADQLIAAKRPGDFNQAWMDLGSMVCTPRSPDCGACPLQNHCYAARTGCTDSLPVRQREGLNVKAVTIVTLIARQQGKMLMRRRPIGGLWSGLWEFPSVELAEGSAGNGSHSGKSRTQALARLLIELHPVADPRHVATVSHRLTHRALTFEVHDAEVDGPSRTDRTHRWVTDGGFGRLAVSTAHRKIHKAARGAAES